MALIKIKQVENLSSELSGLSTDILAAESTAIVIAGSLDTVQTTALEAYADSAESDAIAVAGSLDTVQTTALEAYADSAESDAIAVAGSLDTVQTTALEAYADSAESDAIVAANAYADSLDVLMDGRVDTLEAAIIEDDEFFVETFTGSLVLGPYTLANSVQDNEEELVWAYVNGISVEVASVSGTQVTLTTPGYAIDANDTVKFHYQSA